MTYSIAGGFNCYGQYLLDAKHGRHRRAQRHARPVAVAHLLLQRRLQQQHRRGHVVPDGRRRCDRRRSDQPGWSRRQRPTTDSSRRRRADAGACGRKQRLARRAGGFGHLELRFSGTDSTGTTDNYTPTWNKAAGESAALYNTPTSGISALSHYGALAMNQLFTVYAQQNPSAATAVATADGTLDWHYVAGGLPGDSAVSARSPRACTMSNSTAPAAAWKPACPATPTWTAQWTSTT